ncbi:MAG: hypothetical protein NTX65_05750 [Ignavibacteriales bacterium]|nr:hypothetical protein [Ignavibacteriales bacterium]
MKTIYNENESNYSKMIKDLQNLPKVEAPENFEFNLMTRIKNKNFGIMDEEKQRFNWVKFLAPSAVVVTAIILLFVFLPSSQQIDNPLLNSAQKVGDQQSLNNKIEAGNDIAANNSAQISNSAVTNKNSSSPLNQANSLNKMNVRFPFGASRSVSLDDYISGSGHQRDMQRGNIVNSGNEPAPYDGFFISEKPDQNTLNKYRAQIDSLRKAQMKADSLKKVQKMP